MNELSKTQLLLQQIGACAMLSGAAMFPWWPRMGAVFYTVGALLFCPLMMLQRYDGPSFILRRLRRQQLLGLLSFLVAACCMVMQAWHFGLAQRNEWLVFLAVGCVLLLYTAFRIPHELKKE